jgi:transposase
LNGRIVGSVADDPSWQARSGDGFTKARFQVDWDRKAITCPEGKERISWLPKAWPENCMMFEARFGRRDCTPCELRTRCTRAKNEPHRGLAHCQPNSQNALLTLAAPQPAA